MKNFLSILFLLIACSLPLSAAEDVLRWAADTESGAPNVFYENGDLSKLVGFEKDLIEKISAIIGYRAEFHQNDWDSLIPGLKRNLYDVVINGFSKEEINTSSLLLSNPYFASNFSLITQKKSPKIKSILDCNGADVGVLRGSKSETLLSKSLKSFNSVRYPNEYYAFLDLEYGRIDAIFLDGQIARYYVKHFPNLKIVDELGEIQYSIILTSNNYALKEKIDLAIDTMKQNGELDKIIERWDIKNNNYTELFHSCDAQKSGISAATQAVLEKITDKKIEYKKVLPFFAKATGLTLIIAILAMCVAIILGLGLAIMRVYMPKWISFIAVSIIEFLRGTPLLIQLFFMFYGLPYIGITLRPLTVGILTLGINYAAYEAENFRAGMLAVPKGQMEAARALGMSQWQSLRYVILPQAFTFILPPITNDFISLIKDSSLVSLITIVELTKAYMIFATNSSNFFCSGLIVALTYFMLGFPFVRLARWAEDHLKLEKRAYFSKKMEVSKSKTLRD